MDIQTAIDALPVVGGVIDIPVGSHPGSALRMRDNVILRGQGNSTIIPPIINGVGERIYGVGLEYLIVDATLAPGTPYAIDWRDITQGFANHITARGGTYGMVASGTSLYNSFFHAFFNGSVCGAEFYNGANSNWPTHCKFSGPVGLNIIGCNGIALFGGALEWHMPNMTFKTISGDGGSTRAVGIRQEDANHSSTYWNQ